MAAGKGPARRVEREAYWRQLVTKQPASGLSIRAWCARHAASEPSFYAWRRELARRDAQRRSNDAPPAAEFVELRVTPDAASESMLSSRPTGLRIVVPGALVEVAAGFDGETLKRLLGVLRDAASC